MSTQENIPYTADEIKAMVKTCEKYNKAIERMKSWAKGEHPECFSEAQKTAEFIFPELKEKESKGERIRKELIEQIAYIIPNNDEVDDEGNALPSYQERINKYRAWLEKQGEQKSVDKVEPKFKVGDKVTMKGDNTVYTIGIIAPDKTCWLKHGSREYGWATFDVLKHYVE